MRHDTSPNSPFKQTQASPEARAERIVAELHDAVQSLPALPEDAKDLVAQMLAEPRQPVPAGLKEKVRTALKAELATPRRGRLSMIGRVTAAAAAVLVVVSLGLYAVNPWGGGADETGGDTGPMAIEDENPVGRVYAEAVAPPTAPPRQASIEVRPVTAGEPLATDAQPLLVELGEARILMDRGCALKPQRNQVIELTKGRMAIVTRQRLLVVSPYGEFVVAPHRGANQIGRGTAAVVIHRESQHTQPLELTDQRLLSFNQRMVPVQDVLEHTAEALGEALRFDMMEEDRAKFLTLPISVNVYGMEVPEFISVLEQALSYYELDLKKPGRPGEGYVVGRRAADNESALAAESRPAWLVAEVRCGTVTLRRTGGAEPIEVSVAHPMDVPQVLRIYGSGEARLTDGVLAERWPAETLEEVFHAAPEEIHSDFRLHWPSVPAVHTKQADVPEALSALTLLSRINQDIVIARDQSTDTIRLLRAGTPLAQGWHVKRIGQCGVLFASETEEGDTIRYYQRLAKR